MKSKPTMDTYALGRFRTYLDLFFRSDTGDDLKDFFLHEIWKDKLWNQEFQSLRDFTTFLRLGISQFLKRVHRAQIHLQMVAADISSLVPRGRQVEMLIKLPPDHRVGAWLLVVDEIKKHGNSHALVQRTLEEYAGRLSPRPPRKHIG